LGKEERAQMSEKSGNQHLANGLTSLVFGKLQEFDRSRKLNPEDFFNDMLHVIQKNSASSVSPRYDQIGHLRGPSRWYWNNGQLV
jgi:hypothetical protein